MTADEEYLRISNELLRQENRVYKKAVEDLRGRVEGVERKLMPVCLQLAQEVLRYRKHHNENASYHCSRVVTEDSTTPEELVQRYLAEREKEGENG
jgi:hypothetical protein